MRTGAGMKQLICGGLSYMQLPNCAFSSARSHDAHEHRQASSLYYVAYNGRQAKVLVGR